MTCNAARPSFPVRDPDRVAHAREFVIEVADGQYPQMVKFQLVQDKCNLVDEYAEGDVVTVEFDLRGREWNGKYFTNLQAWRMNRGEDGGEGDNAGAAASGANAGNAKSAAPAERRKYFKHVKHCKRTASTCLTYHQCS